MQFTRKTPNTVPLKPIPSFSHERLYVPCIADTKTGRICVRVSDKPTSLEEAELFLKKHFLVLWRFNKAVPQHLPACKRTDSYLS